jgi:hypothetical protein
MKRPDIPRQLRRDILVEAGHRCAIPTCRAPLYDAAHIVAFKEVKEHRFENLIALCPNCHRQYDRGDIDRKSLRQYKANLSVLNSRYGDLERRVLTLFAQQPDEDKVKLPGGNLIFVMYLIDDGYLEHVGHSEGHREDEFPNYDIFRLTEAGREFIQKWLSAERLG